MIGFGKFWFMVSYLDFNLITRLKYSYSSIENELQDETKYIKGQGVMVGGGDDNDASHLIGLPYINTQKKDVQQYWINPNIKENWNYKIVHRPRNPLLFKAPMLLITEGITNNLQSVSAVCTKDSAYRSSLTAIKSNDVKSLSVMSALLNSKFFSYFALQTFSSAGIEREQSHDDEKWTTPYIYSSEIYSKYKEVEKLIGRLNNEKKVLYDEKAEIDLKNKLESLNTSIYKEFNISNAEKSLIDYTNNIIIPVQMQHTGFEDNFKAFELKEFSIEKYAQIFIDRFKPSLDNEQQEFIVEIWHSNQVIGMFFKVIPKQKNQKDIFWVSKKKEDLLATAIKLSTRKITDKLFVQKDFRGFEKEFFYIFKPNEKRLWHEAIGYQDVDEFMDAVLKTNRRTYGRK
jgi:hypothetical protein